MKRGPGPLAIVALCVLLIGVAYITVELIQRTRFNNQRLNAESFVLGVQGRLSFHLDKNGIIRIPETGQDGAQPVVERWSDNELGSRISTWDLTFPVPSPTTPGVVVQKRVMHLTLIQWREWILKSPVIMVRGTQDCDQRTIEELRLRLRNQDLKDILQIGF